MAFSAWATATSATSRLGEAEVRQEDGLPCFAVTAREESRHGAVRVKAVAVADASVKPVTTVWSFIVPSQRAQRVSFAACIRYGQAPDGAVTRPAPPLQPGRIYEVFLNPVRTDSTDPTFGYGATFCLTSSAGGPDAVRQLDDTSPDRRARACRRESTDGPERRR